MAGRKGAKGNSDTAETLKAAAIPGVPAGVGTEPVETLFTPYFGMGMREPEVLGIL